MSDTVLTWSTGEEYIATDQIKNSNYLNYYKPSADFLIAFILLLLFSPLLVTVALLVTLSVKGNPFFKQARPGRHGKIFHILKFKTMRDVTGTDGRLLPDQRRMTPLGKLLRKSSVDELPQLLNILGGDMSFIGPRPLLPEYLPLYSPQQQMRHLVKPGITGLAQINGRNHTSWEERFRYDVCYVTTATLLLDFRILLTTVKKVFRPQGIEAGDGVTMEPFKGNN